MRTRTKLSVLLAASVSLAGCATNLKPVAARISPDIVAPARAGSLLLAGRIVPDERPVRLLGEFTAEGRAAFEEARSARIDARPRVGRDLTGSDIAECLIKGLVIVCPLTLAIRGVALGTVNGVRYIKASAREASLLIPEKHAYSLATMFKDRATSTALAASASRFTSTHDGTDSERRLVVRMKAVETWQVRPTWLGIRIIAEAQAFPFPGLALTPTEHVYEWTYGPLSGWTEDSDELVRQALHEALDVLAESIVSTHTRSGNAEELAAEIAAAVAAAADGGIAPIVLAPDEPAVALVATEPPSISASMATSSPVPAAGDTWTYLLKDPTRRHQRGEIHQVTIRSVTGDAIVEQVASGNRQAAQTMHLKGGYLVRQGAVSLFSPYFTAFDSLEPGTRAAKIENLDPDFCSPRWICSITARVVGKEMVRVPTGEFDAIKVEVQHAWMEVQHAWMARTQGGGARTLTIWYSPETKRAVKVSSRGSFSLHLQSDFDLELASYRLN